MKAASIASDVLRTDPAGNSLAAAGRRAADIGPPLISALIGFGLWEGLVRWLKVPPFVLPPPSLVILEMIKDWAYLFSQLGWTVLAAGIGVVIAIVLGIAAGAGIALSRIVDRMLTPWLVVIHAVPKVVIAPLFLIWFGFGLQSEILFVVTFTFFPVVVATITGLKSADPDVLQLVRSMGASRQQVLRKIMFPSAMPIILSGVKLSISLAPVGAVVGEFVASNQGLGHLLIRAVGDLDTPLAFAAVTLFSIFGVLLWRAAEYCERKLLPWHPSQRGDLKLQQK
jgi:NitT/TauT family transport system permease protein